MGKVKPDISPSAGYLLIEILDKEQKDGFLTVSNLTPSKVGKVVSIGKYTYYQNTSVVRNCEAKVGDIILHTSNGYENIVEDNGLVKYRIVHFEGILGIYA